MRLLLLLGLLVLLPRPATAQLTAVSTDDGATWVMADGSTRTWNELSPFTIGTCVATGLMAGIVTFYGAWVIGAEVTMSRVLFSGCISAALLDVIWQWGQGWGNYMSYVSRTYFNDSLTFNWWTVWMQTE